MDVSGIVEAGVFFLFATITIGGALGLILAQRVAHSMLSLIFCFMAVSGIFILLGAEFLAAIQILVYLASVGLVVLFGIMLTRRQILEDTLNEVRITYDEKRPSRIGYDSHICS